MNIESPYRNGVDSRWIHVLYIALRLYNILLYFNPNIIGGSIHMLLKKDKRSLIYLLEITHPHFVYTAIVTILKKLSSKKLLISWKLCGFL